jgi:transcriptional antiterminator NusG
MITTFNDGRMMQRYAWYALQTRSNYENLIANLLQAKGYEQYVPFSSVRRQWSDRLVTADIPLFPRYAFCRFDILNRLPVLITPGVLTIVSFGGHPAPIPDEEIAALRAVQASGTHARPCPFLNEGQRIRIKSGPLKGLDGILLKRKKDCAMVFSITILQRSVSIELAAEWIEADLRDAAIAEIHI